MNAVVVCRMRWLNAIARPWPLLFATIALCLCGAGAWAQDEAASAAVTAQVLVPEVSATSLPRFEPDGGTRTSRIDMTWLPPQRSALGLSLGMTSIDGLGLAVPPNLGNIGQSLDVGLHLALHARRQLPDRRHRLAACDSAGCRIAGPAARAELRRPRGDEDRPRAHQPGFVAERGFIGFQLESGARITVRRSGGKPMLYYRSKF